jgi:hypothetical protein
MRHSRRPHQDLQSHRTIRDAIAFAEAPVRLAARGPQPFKDRLGPTFRRESSLKVFRVNTRLGSLRPSHLRSARSITLMKSALGSRREGKHWIIEQELSLDVD